MNLDHDAPAGWAAPTQAQCLEAKAFAQMALAESGDWPISARLAAYYELRGNYAGASLSHLQDIHPSSTNPTRVTVADLHAVSLLSVRVPPAATRALINNIDDHANAVNRALSALAATGVRSLRDADTETYESMDAVADALMAACRSQRTKGTSNPWVLVAKLAARKAPNLFPVRDNVVCAALGLLGPGKPRGSWRIDWQVYRALVRDDDIRVGIEAAQDSLRALDRTTHGYEQDELRALDAAMWTYEIWRLAARRRASAIE